MKIKGIPKKRIEELRNASRCKGVCKSIASKVFWASFAPLIISVVAVIISAQALNTTNIGLIATTRPYLSIESITEEDTGDENVYVLLGVINSGQLPATNVDVTSIRMDKEEWKRTEYIQTPARTYTSGNVTITVSGWIVVTPEPEERRDFPSSIVFYPHKLSRFVIPVSKDKWETSVSTGSVIELRLEYSWGRNDYWYVATYILDTNEEWNISLERGN